MMLWIILWCTIGEIVKYSSWKKFILVTNVSTADLMAILPEFRGSFAHQSRKNLALYQVETLDTQMHSVAKIHFSFFLHIWSPCSSLPKGHWLVVKNVHPLILRSDGADLDSKGWMNVRNWEVWRPFQLILFYFFFNRKVLVKSKQVIDFLVLWLARWRSSRNALLLCGSQFHKIYVDAKYNEFNKYCSTISENK